MKHLGAKIVVLPALVLGLLLVMQSSPASLGLGEARVDSFLGQTLTVRVDLLQPSEQALDTLTAEIASAEDHARLGVPTEALALGLRIDVDRSVSPPVLRLSSSRPVNDPFVQILLSARWSGGRMLREYTLFLDPPTVPVAPPMRRVEQPSAPPPVAERSADPRPPVTAAPPPSADPVRPAPAPRVTEAPALVDRVGPVRRGQTLWEIARAWRPDDSVSMNQVLLAILDRNPDAFIDNNINRLRLGAELVMPDLQAVRAITPDQALQRVREQNAAWEALRAAPAVAPAPVAPVVQETPAPPAIEPAESVVEPQPEPERGPQALEPAAEQAPEEDLTGQVTAETIESADGLPRLELTAADDALLTDQQAIGVERERLEQQLDTLVQELRADGLETAALDADVDQIRQAIESNDAGGLLIASEGLASLEQRMRDLRLEREARSAALTAPEQAPSADLVAPQAEPATPQVSLFNALAQSLVAWVLAAVLLVLVLALALAVVIFRRRRNRALAPAAAESAAISSKPAAPALREEAADPLGLKLAELYRLAEDEDRAAFGSAFSDFHAALASEDDPRWREAMSLARVMVPGHPLLVDGAGPEDLASSDSEFGDGDDLGLEALLGGPDDVSDEVWPQRMESDPRDADLISLRDQKDASGDDADLAHIANRLDPDEFGQGKTDVLDLDDEKLEDLFRQKPAAEPSWKREAEDEAPLELDFEFSSNIASSQAAEDSEGEAKAAPEPEADQPDSLAAQGTEGRLPAAPERGPELGWQMDSELAGEVDRVTDQDWFDLSKESAELPPAGVEDDEAMPEHQAANLSDDDAEVKLDLARAYLSMDDADSARALLEEVLSEGSSAHRDQAQQLLDGLTK